MVSANQTGISLYLLSVLYERCLQRQANVTSTTDPSPPDRGGPAVTGKQGAQKNNGQDTDFGAVMYITAVLVFYSLGIVVMIIKYLKTERKEMEEEMTLENFFKGIPSKRLEHEREAVNRVAIRAFHTLTSNATRQDEVMLPVNPSAVVEVAGPAIHGDTSLSSGNMEDSTSKDSSSPCPSPVEGNWRPRERSKHLPRVSLMFRDNTLYERRMLRHNLNKRDKQLQLNCMPSAREKRHLLQRSPVSFNSSPITDSGQTSPSEDTLQENEETPLSSDSFQPRSFRIGLEEKSWPRTRASRDSLRMLRSINTLPPSEVKTLPNQVTPVLKEVTLTGKDSGPETTSTSRLPTRAVLNLDSIQTHTLLVLQKQAAPLQVLVTDV